MSTVDSSAPPGPGQPGESSVDGANTSSNLQQVHDSQPPPHDSAQPQPNGGAEKEAAPHRHSTLDVKGKFNHQKDRIKTKAKPPGGYDSTPIPDAPPGYTVKFVFHSASNLPVADISTGASDPFVEATLSTALPKRHKEDPDLVHRTPTLRRTITPEWEDEWIVANIPSSGFKLKCRLYDEDWPDHNDRLGNVTYIVNGIDEHWEGVSHKEFEVKKRVGSKRAYLLKAATSAFHKDVSMTPRLVLTATVLGLSDSQPNAQVHTVGPTSYYRHFSPVIGRLAGVQVNKNEDDDSNDHQGEAANSNGDQGNNKRTTKYDFQAIEMQLQGPVPEKLYHRYVEFRPVIGLMFSRSGIRGRILHKALTHQHNRIYNFDSSTEYGRFKPCSEEASLQFLKMAHFDHGGRVFTYVITLDGLFRFTETGKEFGIDLLSKHTMHSDVATFIACSGEFFIRRLQKPTASEDPEPDQPTHPSEPLPGGPPNDQPPSKPSYYQLVIDNDSGTYRPDKSVLPHLQKFLEKNFPGLGVVTLACDDEEDQKLKENQRKVKKEEGSNIQMVLNRSPSASSFSSDDISDLDEMEQAGETGRKSKRERMWDMIENDQPLEALKGKVRPNRDESGPSKAAQPS
ncbi:hypothetical protein JX265_006338 [Neoarthrinium moseri]|uniref:C2 domain-containing protein n=1 Tax=Neoarthrinium moseri TaxID=1658444 RepID=A0A9Q0AM10_9PEZI|nr:uncharacterized protein JN550_008272 [Neoarthrinium moseri]KAI1852288.1 hypothetical protein JX266_002466 [Neoarthrinium moseri]KAI1865515.1 hypothetical protein JN550_008272 [Neoarthrinium moseri]KAI1870168.1 hypothetical protein JX265_006338 [Neoarthrinium moseri]